MPPDRGLMDQQTAGVKGIKSRLSFALTMNADGSEKLQPLIIGKFERPRPFKNKYGHQLGIYYRNNAKAWMTTVIYQEWIRNWDSRLRAQGRKILLLQDNMSAHKPPDDLSNITVLDFAPNLTAHVQPADAGIIHCFKAHYRSRFINRAIDRYDQEVTPSQIYQIDILEAIRLAEVAWNEVGTTTIHNCWKKTRILPNSLFGIPPTSVPSLAISRLLNPEPVNPTTAPIEAVLAEEINAGLSELETRGVLQKSNRMDLNSLLNPAGEDALMDNSTDVEIFQAVMEQADGNVDLDAEMMEPTLPGPTRREALQAVSVLSKFLSDMDQPFARQLETQLSKLGRETRREEALCLKPTLLTDYFTSNYAR